MTNYNERLDRVINDWHEFNGVKEGFCPDCKEHCEFVTGEEQV